MPKTEWLMNAPTSATNPKADTPLFPFLVRLIRGENLSMDEASDFFRALTDKNANPAQIAGALSALTAKGETAEELAGMARVMREKAVKIKSRQKNLIDVSGTGASAAKTFNVSTAAALVAAGAGLTVAKQTKSRRFEQNRQRGRHRQTRCQCFRRSIGRADFFERRGNLFYVRAEISSVSAARRRCAAQSRHSILSESARRFVQSR